MAPESKLQQLIADKKDQPQKRTLSELYNAIKKPIQSRPDGYNKHEGDSDLELDNDSVSSCDKSFSADELSEGDLREVQGDILSAINKFDALYNKHSANQQEKQDAKEKKRQARELQKRKEREEKKKRKQKRDEGILTKIPQPAVTMPFQAKNTGNGGNATTRVMERMMAAR